MRQARQAQYMKENKTNHKKNKWKEENENEKKKTPRPPQEMWQTLENNELPNNTITVHKDRVSLGTKGNNRQNRSTTEIKQNPPSK